MTSLPLAALLIMVQALGYFLLQYFFPLIVPLEYNHLFSHHRHSIKR